MRALLVLLAAALLGGCNMVVSETPLFFARDAEGAPPLRPGVWAQRKADCEFDSSKPVKEWPECAGGAVISAGYFGEPEGGDKKAPYVLAAGDPRVLQLEMKEEDMKLMYFFAGLQPLKSDDRGRIIEARTWMVQCGPPPPPRPEGAPEPEPAPAPENETAEEMEARLEREVEQAVSQGLTKELLPGLEAKGGMCIARDQGAVRNAAAKSLAWDEDPPSIIYWVRDGDQ